MKHLGMLKDQVELTGKGGGPIEIIGIEIAHGSAGQIQDTTVDADSPRGAAEGEIEVQLPFGPVEGVGEQP